MSNPDTPADAPAAARRPALPTRARMLLAAGVLAAGAALVSGCTSMASPKTLAPGATEAEVVAAMGKVTGRYTFTSWRLWLFRQVTKPG